MKITNIIATIITYNPDIIRLIENIKSVYRQVDYVLIIDNGSNNFSYIEKEIKEFFEKNKYLKYKLIINNENLGIAKALNQGFEYSLNNNFKWILTLDQDSVCEDELTKRYNEAYEKVKNKKDIGIIAPNIIYENINKIDSNTNITYPNMVITSGSLININLIRTIGMLVEELFIDYVDFEFCLRARLNDYKIIQVNNASLYHQLGESKTYNLFGLRMIATNHSYIRRYYYFRNCIYVYKNYYTKFPKWIMRDIAGKFKTIITILLYEDDKFRKILYIAKGICHGMLNKYGKLLIK